ncbi:DNA mismatch repair protein MutS [Bacillus marinisedimentorum]|uniref:DNA mismatch repair protein MutS n=1 Tax=Bacillus marinisedimentorum TaxID=1821260 RepID=UPI0007E0D51E|nr:DNA mismatch repair protein MutS [Bacillus marinisedimentorum]
MAQYTPMLQQYLKIKAQHKDAFLFFRLGDFYEMFFDDATAASQELEITLTSRDGGDAGRIPMCGVPYHSADNYISQLINKGYKVAICEQVEDPKLAKGVVKREVVQLITPGTVMKENMIDEKENNYIAAVSAGSGGAAVAMSDLTTGETLTTTTTGWEEALQEVYSSGAREVILDENAPADAVSLFRERLNATLTFTEDTAMPAPLSRLAADSNEPLQNEAVGKLFTYLVQTQRRSLDHLQPVKTYELSQHMKLDMYSRRNLELVETIRTKGRKGSLLWLLDKTVTAMGGRMLKQWIERPLLDRRKIEMRHEMVDTLLGHFFEREEIREKLREVYDLERLAGRVAYGNVNARDLIQLRRSLEQVPAILKLAESLENDYARSLTASADPCSELTELLKKGIKEDPPLSVKEGGIIGDGFNEELDQYRDASKNGKRWIAELEQKERQKTGIKSLKIGYNRVFGYYIEVTRANLKYLPEGMYERKQTLTNAERFITPELKEKEALILEAEEKSVSLEYDIFQEIRQEVKTYIPKLQELARIISELDVLQSFAVVSEEYHYVRPEFSEKRLIRITEGRHPVVEKVMDTQEYVANDLLMEEGREQLLITGPNMSGKSTYMRQLALTAILAQIGCFVPAETAVLPLFDQVFTRIGAADDLVSGQSTFMVEMLEAKNALTNATDRSLILLDEIGRGTSTYDGMALAQAIIEYIHDHIGAKTLFSTHYHELTALEQSLANLKNVHVSAIEEAGNVVFLHKVEEGYADKSYGIHVAQLADLPDRLITRAQEILSAFEQTQPSSKEAAPARNNDEVADTLSAEQQLSFFADDNRPSAKKYKPAKREEKVLQTLEGLNILELTPLDAMNELYRLQKELKSKS